MSVATWEEETDVANAAFERRMMEMARGGPLKRNESSIARSGSSTIKSALWTKKIILVEGAEGWGEMKTLEEKSSKILREKSTPGVGANPS